MSLVIAFVGNKGAVVAGDMREITFQGNAFSRKKLEKELYNGLIATDEELEKRATEFGIKIRIRDDKKKIAKQHGILTGEVTSFEEGVLRKRRVYAAAGNYVIAETEGSEFKIIKTGTGSAFLVLGNDITKKITNTCIGNNWKNGSLRDAIEIISLSMETAARVTASVSEKYELLQTAEKIDLLRAIGKDVINTKGL